MANKGFFTNRINIMNILNTIVTTLSSNREFDEKIASLWDFNNWTIIACIECVILLYVLIFKTQWKNHTKIQETKILARQESIDFSNIMNSAFLADELYNDLKVKCHPDRFPDNPQLNMIANELSQEISKNKNSYSKLLTLKQRAEKDLGITFK